MDTIRIEGSFSTEPFMTEGMIKWEMHTIRNKKRYLWYLVIIVVSMILMGVFMDYPVLRNYSCYMGMGAGILLFIQYMLTMSHRDNYRKILLQQAEKFESIRLRYAYHISDDSIHYKDDEKEMNYNWSVVSAYSSYKGYLVLWLGNTPLSSLVFSPQEQGVGEVTFERLTKLAQSKLPYKEIR